MSAKLKEMKTIKTIVNRYKSLKCDLIFFKFIIHNY